jgi:hypothetical protein
MLPSFLLFYSDQSDFGLIILPLCTLNQMILLNTSDYVDAQQIRHLRQFIISASALQTFGHQFIPKIGEGFLNRLTDGNFVFLRALLRLHRQSTPFPTTLTPPLRLSCMLISGWCTSAEGQDGEQMEMALPSTRPLYCLCGKMTPKV